MDEYFYAVVYSLMYIDIFDTKDEAERCLAAIRKKNETAGGWIEKHLRAEIEDNEDE